MDPVTARLAAAWSVAPTILLALAGLAALHGRGRIWAAALALLALAGDLAGAVLAAGRGVPAAFDVPLFPWSPLGLYGVTLVARPSAAAAVLLAPPLLLAAGGLVAARPARSIAARAGTAGALAALAGACWCVVAGDLVSLFLGLSLYLLGTAAVLAAVAGWATAGRRVALAGVAAVGLLACVLLLGNVNGKFQLSQLSTVGFTGAALFGVVLAAAVAAPLAPFQGWLLRCSRHPLAPALAAAGVAVALTLLLATFRVTDATFPAGWQRLLGAGAWIGVLVCGSVALIRGRAPLRFAALAAGRAALVFLAASVATPAAMAAALLYVTLTLPPLAVLWLLVQRPPRPFPSQGSPPTAAAADTDGGIARPARPRPVSPRSPGFWLHVLLLATAACLPGTVGGLAEGSLVTALVAWPSGSELHRVPVLLLDAAILIAGGALLWRPHPLHRLTGWRGWAVLVAAAAALLGPVLAPAAAVESWLAPAAAAAAGTSGAPLTLDVSRVPTIFSAALGIVGAWALLQRLRGREWLPGPARTAVGVVALTWLAAGRAWRRRGTGRAPAAGADRLWTRALAAAGHLVVLLRPLEERYYAAAAVLLAVALIYVVGR